MARYAPNKRVTLTLARVRRLLDQAYTAGLEVEAAQHGPLEPPPEEWATTCARLLDDAQKEE